MRLIDADQIGFTEFELFMISTEKDPDRWKYAFRALSEKISNASIVDAVPVVRCKDCCWCGYCRFGEFLGLNGYCSKGERRTE